MFKFLCMTILTIIFIVPVLSGIGLATFKTLKPASSIERNR